MSILRTIAMFIYLFGTTTSANAMMSPLFPPPDEAFAALGCFAGLLTCCSAIDGHLGARLCSNFPFFLIGIPPIFTDRICRESVTCRHKPEKLRL